MIEAGRGRAAWGLCLVALLAGAARAASAEPLPVIALIIDDLGDRGPEGRRALALPGAVTYSFLPRTPYARELAQSAHDQHKEVMLHLPMEAAGGNRMGPGGLSLAMDREEFIHTLRENIASVPHVRGVNNHMGSLLTADAGRMGWLMEELAAGGGLYFLDSRTTPLTVARTVAAEYRVPNARRDIFLDNERRSETIQSQFADLVRRAWREGSALAIGHPYPETLQVLERLLPLLPAWGVRLVPVSEYIQLNRQQRSWKLWQASLSPSPTDAKSSKPSP